jgi:uncharacterized protein (TIGR04141 family)
MALKKIKKPPAMPLTIYLIKADQGFEALAKQIAESGCEYAPIKFSGGERGKLYYRRNKAREPKWVGFVKPNLDGQISLTTFSAAAVLLIKRPKGVFALTFGYGSSMLPDDCWDDTFGLRVTLNCVNPKRIRSVDRQTFDALASQSRTQVSKPGAFDDFGINVEKDVLRAVTGEPDEEEFGKTMTGIDAVHVIVNRRLDDVPTLLDKFYEAHVSKKYTESFPWVDKMSQVKAKGQIEKLDEELIKHLKKNELTRIWMAAPDLIDWKGISGFKYPGMTEEVSRDLSLEQFLGIFKKPADITLEALKQKRVHCISDATGEPSENWSVYRCLYGEVDLSPTETYFLNNGSWYKIRKDFVEETNDYFKNSIEKVDLKMAAFGGYSSEGAYNTAMAGIYGLHLFDTDLVYDGRKVEICDLYSKEKKFIHVKRYSGSGTLSHLFAQGFVSARLFKSDTGFRKVVHERLSKDFKFANLATGPETNEFQVIFAIVSSEKGSGLTLPFFSRVNLMNVHQDLRMIGFKVALAKISA